MSAETSDTTLRDVTRAVLPQLIASMAAGNGHGPEETVAYQQHPEHPANDGSPRISVPILHFSQPIDRNVTREEMVAGTVVLVLWIVSFTLGLFVPTADMRTALLTGTASATASVGYFFAVGVSYTLTNVLFLACLASFLGCMAHRWQVGDDFEPGPAHAPVVGATRVYLAALLRGFFLYLAFISGFLLVSTEETIKNTEFAQYIRIAGMTSIVGFIVGYDPNLLVRLMHRILSLANLPLGNRGESSTSRQPASGGHPLDAGANGRQLPR